MRRRNRLGSSRLIQQVRVAGTSARAASAAVITLHELDPRWLEPRIAVVASRRVGGSVERSRARRRLRAAIDEVLKDFAPSSATVVTATGQTNRVAFQKLVDDVRTLAWKTGLISSAVVHA